MSEHDVTTGLGNINLAATGDEEVLQNLRMILSSVVFSCPMDRDFAWNPDIDAPMNILQAKLTAQIVDAIQEYETRAEVVKVLFGGDPLNGRLNPIVRVRIADGTI